MKIKAAQKLQAHGQAQARKLLRSLDFLYLTMMKIGELGVVGEKRNRLVLFLAGITKDLDQQVSVLVKGQSASGKSNLMRKVLLLFPPECVISRASLSAKAPVHGEGSLQGKIFYLFEYRGGKDAQYLLRLQQSEKMIAHEYTTIRGSERETIVSERVGSPVIFTTTTESKVFTDDETRFLSTWIDDSSQQTLAIMQSQVAKSRAAGTLGIASWQEAIRLIGRQRCEFHFADWFREIPRMVPTDNVRVRRDWERFLTFCKAVALCRSFTASSSGVKPGRQVTVSFADYCVTHIIVNAALASSVYTLHERELALAEAVRKLTKKFKKPAALQDVATFLGWKRSLVYKYLRATIKHKLVREVDGKRQSNRKLLESIPGARSGFLPSPEQVLRVAEGISDDERNFVHPLTGELITVEP
jgi:hypothetical protein